MMGTSTTLSAQHRNGRALSVVEVPFVVKEKIAICSTQKQKEG